MKPLALFQKKKNFILTFLFVEIILLWVRLICPAKIIFYGEFKNQDSLQVFFEKNGEYSESNSETSKPVLDFNQGLRFDLPVRPIRSFRFDPGNSVNQIRLTRVEFHYFFRTILLDAEAIMTRAKPIQMIGTRLVKEGAFIVDTNGTDPAIQLLLSRWPPLLDMIALLIAGVALAFFLTRLTFAVNFRPRTTLQKGLLVIGVPLLFSVVIASIFYPGAMSYDSLHSLRSARNGIVDSIWPPIVSYVWRFVDLFSTNPSAMHLTQVAVLLVSYFTILFLWTQRVSRSAQYIVFYLITPVILGTLAVIWKDVLMAAFLVCGFSLTLLAARAISRKAFIVLILLAIFSLFLGTGARHNGLAGAAPIIGYLALISVQRFWPVLKSDRKWMAAGFIAFALTSGIYGAKKIFDNYSLPGFVPLKNETYLFLEYVRVFDVAGASICAHENLFQEMAPNRTVEEIAAVYDPRHINLSLGVLDMVHTDGRIHRIWKEVALQHPLCFFSYKLGMSKYMLGLNGGDQFLITQVDVEKNEYGYHFEPSRLRDKVYGYIIRSSHFFFFKPYFLYILSLLALAHLAFRRILSIEHLTFAASGLLYLLSLFLFGNAADARLPFFSTTALLAVLFAAIDQYRNQRKQP